MVRDQAKAQGKVLFDGTSKCQEARESTWGGDSQGQAIGRAPGMPPQYEQGSPFPWTPSWAEHSGTASAKMVWKPIAASNAVVWVQASKGWKTESKLLVYNLRFETTVWVAKLGAFYSLRSYRSKWGVWGCFLKLSLKIFFSTILVCSNFEEETLETKSWLLKF